MLFCRYQSLIPQLNGFVYFVEVENYEHLTIRKNNKLLFSFCPTIYKTCVLIIANLFYLKIASNVLQQFY